MIERIFPRQIDNAYRGPKAAVWLLALYLLVKTFACINQIGLNPALAGAFVLQNIEGVPLESFSASAKAAALALFASWGVAGLAPTLLGLIALMRYRAITPLFYLVMLATKVGEQSVAEAAGADNMLGAGATMPFVVIAMLASGFVVSVVFWRPMGR